jgi:integrase
MRQNLKILKTGTAFSQIANKRLDYVQAYCTKSHYRDNVTRLKKFADWWDLDINQITPDMIRQRMIDLSAQMSRASANKHLVALKSVFEMSVTDGVLGRNPCRGIRFFPIEKTVKFVPAKDQIAQVLLLAQPLDRAYLTVIWQLGARVREINNLVWEDTDFERRQVRLWTRKKRGGNKTPRLVGMSDSAESALAYAWKQREKSSPYVFTNPRTGKAYDYRDKFFNRLCRLAGVPEMGYHALRHAKASEMALGRVPLTRIRDFLGHEDISTTSKYLHSLAIDYDAVNL